MSIPRPAVRSEKRVPDHPTGKSRASVLRLRLLIKELINEVESLDAQSLSFSDISLLENGDHIDFYDEVKRFETALITSALRRSGGHQINAARLLNLNPSTLNAKIKQYEL